MLEGVLKGPIVKGSLSFCVVFNNQPSTTFLTQALLHNMVFMAKITMSKNVLNPNKSIIYD
jgi:hypothetical protein